MDVPTLGIMTCRTKNLFFEKKYFRTLQKYGDKHKIKTFVFYPDSIDVKKRKVTGYRYDFQKNEWKMGKFPFPNFIYDRCFYGSKRTYRKYKPYREFLQSQKNITFLGIGLKGKWQFYEILSTNASYKKYIPKTEIFTDITQLIDWCKLSPVILKPIGGSSGKGILKVTHSKKEFYIVGRDFHNKKIHYSFKSKLELKKWILNFTNNKRYIIQKYLDLTTSKNVPFDIRLLVQKNSYGKWELTGSAARIGVSSNITSNLHGGGKVANTSSLLIEEFGSDKANEIENELIKLSNNIPKIIEANHGKLFELGLDIGIDKSGQVWIIEANSKPGRNAFVLLNDEEVATKSITQPILYTKYLADSQ